MKKIGNIAFYLFFVFFKFVVIIVDFRIIVDLRINETLQTGAVKNRTYQVRGESVYLFLEFTIVIINPSFRLEGIGVTYYPKR